MNHAIVEAIQLVVKEKNIEGSAFQELIQSVFLAAIKKNYGTSDNFDVIFNMDKGDIEIYCEKTIVEDGAVEDPVLEIELSKAQEEDADFEVGDDYVEIVDFRKFGRRAILSIKQNLIQRIKEIEKDNLFNEFAERTGEIVIADIHQIGKKEIRLNIDKTEVVMPMEEKIYNERYKMGQSLRCIIKEARKTAKDPEIIVSRAAPQFIKRLFELEVPEIYDNIIEIKAIAREAGDRTKIAVSSNDKRIDPVGACVGMKGVRIQAIVKELNNEKIDIIAWSDDIELFIRRALSPVVPTEVIVNYDKQSAQVIIPDDNIASAVGRKGQNIRLASILTGYALSTIKESDYYEEEIEIASVEQIKPGVRKKLEEAGYHFVDEILDAGTERLLDIPGIGKETASKIIDALESLYEEPEEDDDDDVEETQETESKDENPEDVKDANEDI